MANKAGADVLLRIHANGSEDPSVSGALALVPSAENAYVGGLSAQSAALAQTILHEYCSATVWTIWAFNITIPWTGINWSEQPVVILEMGFYD